MANDYSQYNTTNGYTGFNYGTESDILKRKQAAAAALQGLGTQTNQGQFVSSPMGTFYAGGNNAATTIARLAAAYLGTEAQKGNDDAQKALDSTSSNALAYDLDPANASWNQGAKDTSTGLAPTPMVTPSQAPGAVDDAQYPQNLPVSGASPLTGPAVALPPVKSIAPDKKVAARALAPASAAGAASSGQSALAAAALAPPTPALPPPSAQQYGSPSMDAGAVFKPITAANPNPQPGMPAPQQPQAPMPMQAAPQQPASAAPTQDPGAQAAMAIKNTPSLAEQVKQLTKISQTGPLGQQIASAQMNQLFASKNGRYTTDVKQDTVNGGFLAVTTDTQTGATATHPLSGGSGQGAFEVQTGADGTRMKVFKNGSPSVPVTDAQGNPLKDSAVTAHNDEQTIKMGAAVTSNQAAQAAVQSSITRLQRIDQLAKETFTGPIVGHLPDFTSKRQELHALMAQDVFAETKDAVSGAADSGGAPKMAANEFKYMEHNGGLSQNMDYSAIHNLIGQQMQRLGALNQTLAQYGTTLQTVAPPTQRSDVPARGQTVSAAQFGFH